MSLRIADLQVKKQQWPLPGPDVQSVYKMYLIHFYKLDQIIRACCDCILRIYFKYL